MNEKSQKPEPPKASQSSKSQETRNKIGESVKNWWNNTLGGAVEREIRHRKIPRKPA